MHNVTIETLQKRLEFEIINLGEIEMQITNLNNRLDELYDKEKEAKRIIKTLEMDLDK